MSTTQIDCSTGVSRIRSKLTNWALTNWRSGLGVIHPFSPKPRVANSHIDMDMGLALLVGPLNGLLASSPDYPDRSRIRNNKICNLCVKISTIPLKDAHHITPYQNPKQLRCNPSTTLKQNPIGIRCRHRFHSTVEDMCSANIMSSLDFAQSILWCHPSHAC